MKTYDAIVFDKDMEFADDLFFSGETTVNGSLKGFSFNFEKDLEVKSSLEATRGAIISASAVKIGKDMISVSDITIKGKCEVAGKITGGNITFTGNLVTANAIIGETVQIRGKITVKNGIFASKAIQIDLNPRRYPVNINNTIQAPKIVLFFRGFYTKWYKVPTAMLGLLRRKRRMKKVIKIEDLSISTEKLVIQTFYSPESVEVQYINSAIDAKETELVAVSL
ncbi:MAG: hypothetical protein ACFFE8_10735 [Candidatus Heimdallarchaeota archaeon]